MSSTQVTVRELIEKLNQYPDDMLVVIDACWRDVIEMHEGMLDGPCSFNVIDIVDRRSGFNPASICQKDHDVWKGLLIQ